MSAQTASAGESAASGTVAAPQWEGKRRGGRLGNGFFVVLTRTAVGRALAPFFLFWVALYFLVAVPKTRRVSFDLARRVGRGESALGRLSFAFRHFYTYGAMLIERMALLGGGEELFEIEKHGEESIREGLEEGRGVLLLSSHLGNWEAMAQCLSCIDAPVTLVMYDGVQPQVKAALESLARERSFDVLYTDGGPVSAAGILSALRQGRIVGMMADRTLAGRGVKLPFLGGLADFSVGPYSIAAASRAPVVQVFAMRIASYRYAFHGFSMGVMEYRDRRRKDEDFERWGARYAERLEEFTRRYPHQWGNLYPFWGDSV